MKNLILSFLMMTATLQQSSAQSISLPDSLYSGKQGNMHVQGIAVDQKNGYVYFSFTDKLVKTDLSGKLIGSVTGFVGHLGDIDLSDDGKIYGSLEYKNDEIGQGINKKLGLQTRKEDGFYVAIFDGSKIIRADMNAEKGDLIRTVYIKEAVDDYNAIVKVGDAEKPHRFACSGIDGLTFAPVPGSTDRSKMFLYIAYGIYGDTTRNDNDNQVILQYDVSNWNNYAQPLMQDKLHHSGPEKPMEKYFVKTGNTRYGIQNLAYDPNSGNLFAAVYKGSKMQYPNYNLFVIDGRKKAITVRIQSGNQPLKVKTLSLLKEGPEDLQSGIRGWTFNWGATGLCPLGNGYFYLSHNNKTKDGQQETTLYKYQWRGDQETAFVKVNPL